MKKEKQYRNVRFDSTVLLAAAKTYESLISAASTKTIPITFAVQLGSGETWSFDSIEELLAAADQGAAKLHLSSANNLYELIVYSLSNASITMTAVRAPARSEIEAIFSILDENVERCRVPEPKKKPRETKIFIGHGRSPQWQRLKNHLHEKHGYAVEAYEIGSREGHAIRDVLEQMLNATSFALLVMTGEDKTNEGKLRARQNVVHEAGLFQGKLGFSRAIILLEKGTEEFSNIAGLQQLRFSKGRIAETFGDVLAVLKREVG